MNIIQRRILSLIRHRVSWFWERMNWSLIVWWLIGSYSAEEWCCCVVVLKFKYMYKVIYGQCHVLLSLALFLSICKIWSIGWIWPMTGTHPRFESWEGKINHYSLAATPGRQKGGQQIWNSLAPWWTPPKHLLLCYRQWTPSVSVFLLSCPFWVPKKQQQFLDLFLQFFQKFVSI